MYYDSKALDKVDFSAKGELKLKRSKKDTNVIILKPTTEENYNKCRENTSKQIIMEYLKISDNEYALVDIISNSKQDFTDSIISRVEICNTNTNELKEFYLDEGDNIVEKLGDTYNGKPSIEIQNNNELISISYPGGAQLVKIDNGAATYNSCDDKGLEARGCEITDNSDGSRNIECPGDTAAEVVAPSSTTAEAEASASIKSTTAKAPEVEAAVAKVAAIGMVLAAAEKAAKAAEQKAAKNLAAQARTESTTILATIVYDAARLVATTTKQALHDAYEDDNALQTKRLYSKSAAELAAKAATLDTCALSLTNNLIAVFVPVRLVLRLPIAKLVLASAAKLATLAT